MSGSAIVETQSKSGSLLSAAPALFRHEVLDQHRTQWLGAVLLEPKVSSRVSVALSIASAIAIIALLTFGSYTRKERISGWIVPERGIARVLPPQPGVVQSIAVKEGARVSKGDPLIVLSTELQTESVGATGEEVVRQLTSRRNNLVAQKETEQRLERQQAQELASRIEALTGEYELLAGEIELQRQRSALTKEAVARARYLRDRGIVTKAGLGNVEADHIDQTSKLQSLERSLSQLRREIATATLAQSELPFQTSIKSAALDRDAAEVDQQIAEAESRRQIVISAPQDGMVTAIQTEPGGNAAANVPVLSIVPKDTVLQAQLFAQSKAVGFIRTGQQVLLRYQSFPYQNFGFYRGKVTSVSLSAISPAELPQQLSGLSGFYGANEPFYRITVALERQDVTAYGRQVPLQPGMQLDADVQVENHKLYEWILYPILSRTSAWAG